MCLPSYFPLPHLLSVSTSLYSPTPLCSYLLDVRHPDCRLLPVTTDDTAVNVLVPVILRRIESVYDLMWLSKTRTFPEGCTWLRSPSVHEGHCICISAFSSIGVSQPFNFFASLMSVKWQKGPGIDLGRRLSLELYLEVVFPCHLFKERMQLNLYWHHFIDIRVWPESHWPEIGLSGLAQFAFQTWCSV